MSGLLIDDQIAVLREQGFVVLRGFASPEQVAALRAVAERHLRDHVAPIEYEADLRYPGAPESRAAEGGLATLRTTAFRHVHDLSTLTQNTQRRGALVSLVLEAVYLNWLWVVAALLFNAVVTKTARLWSSKWALLPLAVWVAGFFVSLALLPPTGWSLALLLAGVVGGVWPLIRSK